MKRTNSGVTERAVYWPRKCSQAAGQSAWLISPRVTNSPLANESRPLFAVSIDASHHQRGAVYLSPPSPTHTTSPSLSIHPSLAPLPSSSQFVALSPETLLHNTSGQIKTSRRFLKTAFLFFHFTERLRNIYATETKEIRIL